ncbi:rac GTPase-activating protein 1-like [Nylanderia fulva]|uniref:rac GTPase-activating protein 1-like n=1 Tax=Nylanderia fulva TaxID=613905 RepID=UPI0010FB5E09|nr:rac GTPase-activating protein 1-like [Nylanderia fulva]XP_029168427.1 rac GTPase-activating protein 1-like [Nylanderia fulva]XP_029168429.1 rac GTPase-activating protein 1-like [Nylanderia fulva]XP_029168430.1 rac GTPase-activating protein 1-like [Nylanderia fulva]
MSSLANNNELHEVSTNVPQMKYLPLQEYQQLCLDLHKAHQKTANLNQKLYHARKNLEDEKRKRRVVEHYKNLLENQINTTRKVLFHDGQVKLDEEIKKKLQFLVKPMFEIRMYNNIQYGQDKQFNGYLTTIAEMDSTGSILSDLNCLSKSEDDLNTDAIIQKQKMRRDYKLDDDNSANGQCSTLDKVAEFNSIDRVTTSTRVKINDDTHTAPFKIQVTSNKKNTDSKLLNTETFANHSFVSKIVIKPETCILCNKRIRFGKIILRCRSCPVVCHAECKMQVILSFSCVCEEPPI